MTAKDDSASFARPSKQGKVRSLFVRASGRLKSGLCILALAARLMPLRAADVPLKAEVCIYGATPAGITAAVAAAREGSKVILVEPTGLLGGIMSSGLGYSDSSQMAREALGGLFDEFHRRVGKYYLEHVGTEPSKVTDKQGRSWIYEPHVAELIFTELVRDAGVEVLLHSPLRSVDKEGGRLQKMHAGAATVESRVFIDASYEGDLMASAGVSHRIGREPAYEFRETLAGHQFGKRSVAASPFDGDGKLLPLMTARDPGDPTKGDRHVMAASFRFCVTEDPANQVPFPEPAHYDPAQFELLRRYLATKPGDRHFMDFYRLPNGKWDVNNSLGRQFSLALVGAADEWPEADEAGRQKIWELHKEYTLGLIYFILHDPAVPALIRENMQQWGLCKDEFAASDHWPPQLYVREARRMNGSYMMAQADIQEIVRKPDSIGVGSFPVDSHDCQRVATPDGGFVDEGMIYPVHIPTKNFGRPYQVPFRSITPKVAECDNLLVPVCVSATHVAFCSIRVEPEWMVLGQSAGIAAALAAKNDVKVQDLDYGVLRERLLAQKQVLDLDKVHETLRP